MKIYGIKNCDTIKKALKWLDEQHIPYSFHDYKKAGVPEEEVERWIAEFGWETIINKRGTTWRQLPDEVKNNMNAATALAVACDTPSIIKRPVLDTGTHRMVGFNEQEWQAQLNTSTH